MIQKAKQENSKHKTWYGAMLGRKRQSEDAAEDHIAREELLSRSQLLCCLIHYINEGGRERERQGGGRKGGKKEARERGRKGRSHEFTR